MSISLNTDMNTLLAQRSLSIFNSKSLNIVNRLSSGIRINSASDDAANLAVSKKLEGINRGLDIANRNIQTGLTKLQTLDGYLGGLTASIHRMRDLAVQSANGVYADSEKAMLNQEAQELMGEIKQGTKVANQDMQSLSGQGGAQDINQLTEVEAVAQGYTVIKTAQELADIDTTDLAGKYILGNDIDMSSFSENNSVINGTFTGEFNGNGYEISNLTISSGSNNVGLISRASATAEMKNIALENVNISGVNNVGGLVGSSNGTISNSYATGSVSGARTIGGLVGSGVAGNIIGSYSAASVAGSDDNVGGLAGYGELTTITNSYATGNVSGGDTTGGLLGQMLFGGDVIDSFATGNVSSSGDNTGGLVGQMEGNLTGSYATGNVSGIQSVGGLTGTAYFANISNSYATGDVDAAGYASGGFAGYMFGSDISNSYATGSVYSSDRAVGGFVGSMHNAGSISNSYSTGFVEGDSQVGGFAGEINFGNTINNNNFWNTDIMTNGVGDNSGSFNAQGLTSEEISANGVSILGSAWASNGVTAQQKVFNQELSMQVGVDGDSNSAITIENIQINTNFDVDLTNANNSKASMKVIDAALNYVTTERAFLGAQMNRLESVMEANSSRSDGLATSVSTIRDTDMGYEASRLMKNQILSQSAMSIMQQAQNFNANIVLSLI